MSKSRIKQKPHLKTRPPNMNYSLHIPRPSLTGSTTSTRSGGSSTHSYSESNSYLPVGIHSSSPRNLLVNNNSNYNYNNNNNNNKNNNSHEYEYNNKINNNNAKNLTNIEYKNERRNSISSSTLDNDRKNQSNSNSNNNNNNRLKNKQKRNNDAKFNKSMDDRFNYNTKDQNNYECDIGQLKRGSRSSQGSTDSHNSTGTASSGSLLLTTANLERFVAIHNNKNKNLNNTNNIRDANVIKPSSIMTQTTTTDQLLYTTNNNLTKNDNNQLNIYTIPSNHMNKINGIVNDDDIEHNSTMLEIDPNLHFIKTKDVDAVSIASSTHFTMVNGVGGPQRKTKNNGICRRGHQLTVLILTMSGFFLIGILLMVYLMEMRAREMPQM